jgi:RNA polymerase sigma-70 factor (ECF subfamily)
MMQPTLDWLPRLRRWWNAGPHNPRAMARRLHLEPLEDRTGLSATPAAPLLPPPDDQQTAAIHLVQPVVDFGSEAINWDDLDADAPAVDDIYHWGDEASFGTTTLNDPGYSTHKNAGQHDQPAELTTAVQTESVSTSQRPALLARTAVDAFPRDAQVSNYPRTQYPVTDRFFQIERTPVTQQPLEVQYEVKGFTSTGALVRQQSAIFAAGSGIIEVNELPKPLRQGNIEIVTLTLTAQRQYQLAQSNATLFIAGPGQACSESALLRACQEASSPEALSALIERHRPRVLQTCYSVLGNFADAEDASQIVFMMFAQQHFKLHQTVGRWLHAVARNVAISFLRSRQRRKKHELQAMKSEMAPLDETPELREELDQAMQQLPAPLRQAVKLRYLDGWSQEETAEILGCPRGTVAQRAARGLAALRRLMTPAIAS